jgi:hypothetical protein
MSLPFADPYEGMTPQRWHELLQRERCERDAARRRLVRGLALSLRSVVGYCCDLAMRRSPPRREPANEILGRRVRRVS